MIMSTEDIKAEEKQKEQSGGLGGRE